MQWKWTSTVLLWSLGCAAGMTARPTVDNDPPETPTPECLSYDDDPDTQFPEGWFEDSPADGEAVSLDAASDFAERVFGLVDEKFYDPSAFAVERAHAREEALKALASTPELTRESTAKIIQRAFQSIGVSHLYLLAPEHARALEERTESRADVESRVAARMDGEVGILEVGSFLVPEIGHEKVQRALESLQPAKRILIDLRGNGGGSTSPVVYLAQYFVGPDRVLLVDRNRCSLSRSAPYVHHGFFADEVNAGSAADVALLDQHGYVQRRTPIDAPPADTRPVFLLVDGHCGSGCEVFAAAMQEYRAAWVIGEKTAGAVLVGLGFMPPWKGYLLIAPTAAILTPNGGSVEGKGVIPDLPIAECQRSASSDTTGSAAERCLAKALEVVRQHKVAIE